MSRPNPLILIGILIVTGGALAGLSLAKGALLISAHEGDTYHLLDILFRMQRGEVPHRDFVTPLGLLSVAPILLFLNAGFDIGASILWSQVLVAGVLLLPTFYVAQSRLGAKSAYGFAAFVMVLALALTFGGSEPGLSISMHYNRWAWAVASLVIVLAMLPGRARAVPLLDGLVIGFGLAALVLLKVTFFVALAPGVLLLLALQSRMQTLVVTILAGLVVALGVTFFMGLGFWFGYAGDLLNVARSDVRPFPGVPFSGMISSPLGLATSALMFAMYLFLSRAGHRIESLGLVLLAPGFFYITYQNFGNDPKWMVPMIVVLLALRPEIGTRVEKGVDMRIALTATATAAAALFAPSAISLAMSPLRHYAQPFAEYDPMLPALERHQDIGVRIDRAYTLTAQFYLDQPDSVWSKYREIAERPEPPTLAGVTFPYCEILAGTSAWFKEITADLVAADIPENSQFFTTDILTAFWLFGPFEPLQNGAPWYYGDLSGIENADYVLVPKCSFVSRVYGIMLDELNASEVTLTPVRDNELYALFSVN